MDEAKAIPAEPLYSHSFFGVDQCVVVSAEHMLVFVYLIAPCAKYILPRNFFVGVDFLFR